MTKYLLRLSDKIHNMAIEQAEQEDRSVASLYRKIIYRYFQKRRKNPDSAEDIS